MPFINRRTLLKGLGGAVMALPWLEATAARAQASVAPKRFITFFTGNGSVRERWFPTGSEATFALSPILAPLEPYKSKLLVLDGIELITYGGSVHAGMGHLLIGRALADQGGPGGVGYRVGGPSVDQEMANQRGAATRFRSMEIGVQSRTDEAGLMISHRGPGLPNLPELDPRVTFDRMFSASDRAGLRRRARRLTVLDAVKDGIGDLTGKLGSEDRQRLDAHLTSVRELERRIESEGAMSCAAPNALPILDPAAPANFETIGRLQTDLLVLAMACDLTRIATLMWSNGLSQTIHRWITVDGSPIDRGHHDISHEASDNLPAQRQLEAINTWYSGQFAYLLSRMSAVREGDKTLLDNSTVFWGSEISIGNSHDVRRMPFVLAGSSGGYFRTGRYLRLPDRTPHNKLLVSFLNGFGIETDSFGDPAFGSGPLPGLT